MSPERETEPAVLELLVFRAEWCAPCHRLAPRIAEATAPLGDRLRTVVVDLDRSPEVAERHGVRSLPTLLLLRDGREVARTTGLQTVARLATFLEGGDESLR